MGVGGLITGIMGATGDYPHANVPRPGQVARDYLGLVSGYQQAAPQIYQTESQYQPKYNQLALDNLGRTVPQLTNIMGTSAPAAANLVRNLNPGQASLMDSLTQQAQQGLDSGSSLDPGLQRLFQQSVRGGQAARGMGYGPSDVLGEGLGMTEFGQQLRQQRQGFAQNVEQVGSATETTPALQMLQQLIQGGNAVATGSGPSLLPTNQSYDMFNTAYNARAAAGIADANTQTAMLGGFNSFD